MGLEELSGKARLFLNWMPEKADSLLDIGCASSFMLNLLGKRSRKRFGLDIELEKIIEGKSRFDHIDYVCASGEELPFKVNSIDVVTFFEVLEHVDNEKEFMKEIYRVLKPNGAIMLSVPNKGAVACLDMDNVFFTPILSILKRLGFFENISDYYLKSHRHYSAGDLETLFKPFFKIEKVYYGGLFVNQLGFLIYKSLYILLLLLKINMDCKLFRILSIGMDRVSSWDFEHSFGRMSDKLSIYAVKII